MKAIHLELSAVDQEKLEIMLEKFDRSWHLQSLAEWMEKWPKGLDSLRLPTLVEMVKIDLDRRWQAGEPRRLEFYMSQHPELGTPETLPGELIEAEIEVFRDNGQKTAPADYQKRFPGREKELAEWLSPDVSSIQNNPALQDTAGTAGSPQETPFVVGAGVASVSLPEQFGRYRVLKPIGEGGMGSVFLAHDSELNRDVALKVPRIPEGADVEVLARFQREARSAAKLEHPNVCPVHDVGVINEMHFISMAYIRGRPLSDFVRKDKPPSPESAALVVRNLAKTLHYAHSQGIVHRDLKPSNVMMNERNQPIVMDFGLARKMEPSENSRMTSTGVMLGSPAYMPPEQVKGELDKIGPHTDIFSLGVIFYELLTGELPFAGETALAVATRILTEEPKPPAEIRQGIDPGLEAICLKMLAKEPADRYASAKDVANAIAAHLKSGKQSPAKEPRNTAVIDKDEMLALQGLEAKIQSGSHPVAPKLVSPPGFLRSKWPHLAALGIAGILFAVIILIKTPKGTIRVEVADPSLNVIIDGDTLSVQDLKEPLTFKTGKHTILVEADGKKLAPGQTLTVGANAEKRLVVKLGEIKLEGDRFEVRSQNNPLLKISWEPVPNGPAGGGKEYALKFDGKSSYVKVPGFTYRGDTPITIEVVVTPTEVPERISFIVMNGSFGIELLSTGEWSFGLNDGGQWIQSVSLEAPTTNKTCHLAGVFDGKFFRLFVDGKPQGPPCRIRRGLSISSSLLTIGAEPKPDQQTDRHFPGYVHAIRVSTIARYRETFEIPREITSDGFTKLMLSFDDGVGPVARDDGPHNLTATIHGANWVAEDELKLARSIPNPKPRADEIAIRMNGHNTYLAFKDFRYYGGPFTLEAYVTPYAASFYKDSDIICNEDADGGTCLGIREQHWTFMLRSGNARHVLSRLPARMYERVHLAGVFDGKLARLFVNGKLQGDPVALSMKLPPWNWLIGGDPNHRGGPTDHFRGLIEQVRISKSARYLDDFIPERLLSNDSDTVCLLPMDENIDPWARDRSGNSTTAYLRNGEWVDLRRERALPRFKVLPRTTRDGHTYAVLTRNVEWPTAAWICKEFGGDLATAETDSEYEFLRQTINKVSLDKGDPTRAFRAFHVGVIREGGDWYWLSGRSVPDWYWRNVPKTEHRNGVLLVDPSWWKSSGQVQLWPHLDNWAYVLCEWGREFSDAEWNRLVGQIEEKLDDEEWLRKAPATPPQISNRETPSESVVSAMYFNGVDSRIDVSTFHLSNEPPITIEAIVTSFWNSAQYIPKEMNINEVIAADFEAGGIGLGIEPNGKISFTVDDKGERYVSVNSTKPMPTIRRSHIAGVWDGQKITLFVDGIEQSSKSDVSLINDSRFYWILGCNRDVSKSYNMHFLGLMHEFRISRAACYERSFDPPKDMVKEDSTLLLYRFDQAKGDETEIKDLSGNGHTGKLHNTRWVKVSTPGSQ